MNAWLRRVITALLLLACVAWPTDAAAHGRDTSHARWQPPRENLSSGPRSPAAAGPSREGGGRAELALRISARDFERIGDAQMIVAHMQVDGCAAIPESLEQRRSVGDEWLLRWALDCRPHAGARELHVGLFDLLGPAHVHMLGVAGRGDTQVLSAAQPTGTLAIDDGAQQHWFAFVALGFAHMLEGWDHLAFVLALLLAATRIREVAVLVTGFTIGHSLTLALAVLGVARPDPGAVELSIAASVVILAVQEFDRRLPTRPTRRPIELAIAFTLVGVIALIRVQPSAIAAWGAAAFAWGYLHTDASPSGRRRMLITAGFGLIHGAGFAGVLQAASLPAGGRALSLLGFNLGVELGQLCFVALAWPALWLARRRALALERSLALALIGVGMCWVVLRAAG